EHFRLIPKCVLRSQDHVDSAAFSPDGRTLLTNSRDKTDTSQTSLWDVATGSPIGVPLPHASWPLVFRPDGRAFLGGFHPLNRCNLQLWGVAGGEPRPLWTADTIDWTFPPAVGTGYPVHWLDSRIERRLDSLGLHPFIQAGEDPRRSSSS